MCAKYTIDADLKLSKVNVDKNWCFWSAVDYSADENGKSDKFAACFETEEQCVDFRKVIERAQSSLEKVSSNNVINTHHLF